MEAIGLETRVAENGARCLEIFRDWPADLIWMDRRMPVMDGVEAAQRVRQLPGGESVKIVAVTASAFTEQQDEMLAAGMDEFVRKPYRASEIYECLARQLGLKFIYGEEPKTAPAAIATPTAEQVTALPVALRQELAEALTELDSERIASLLDQVQQLDSQLGGFLSRLAEGFDYPAMLNVLQKASDEEYS
jgi:CheY-like chemotaxis protein